MTTDPVKIIENAWEALQESNLRYTTAGMTTFVERSKDYLAAVSKFDAACHEHIAALLAEVRELRIVKDHAEATLAEIRQRHQAEDAEIRQLREVVMRLPAILSDIDVNDELSINCRAGTFLVEICPSFKTIGGHNNSILDALAWLRGADGIAAVDAARKA